MYLKTIKAIRTSLLFRPMLPESPDILFSGSLVTDGKPDTNDIFSGDVEHLTCFIGGMVGMGARIFDIKDDLESCKETGRWLRLGLWINARRDHGRISPATAL